MSEYIETNSKITLINLHKKVEQQTKMLCRIAEALENMVKVSDFDEWLIDDIHEIYLDVEDL